jgi:GDP-mannose 4,6 dehydratase
MLRATGDTPAICRGDVVDPAAERARRLCAGDRRDAFGARVRRKGFAHIGRPLVWRGRGVEEKGVDQSTGRVLVEIDPRYFRPTEVDSLLGDASKARAKLGWRHRTSFEQLVTEMVEADVVKIREERERRNRHA